MVTQMVSVNTKQYVQQNMYTNRLLQSICTGNMQNPEIKCDFETYPYARL